MLDIKKSNLSLTKQILNDKQSIAKKEKLLQELTMEINHFKNQNNVLKQDLEITDKLKQKCEKNQKGVTQYCNGLRGKFKNFVETIEMYEKTIKELKIEEENIIKTNDEKLNKLNRHKKGYEEEIADLRKKSEIQEKSIREMEGNIDLLQKKERRAKISISGERKSRIKGIIMN